MTPGLCVNRRISTILRQSLLFAVVLAFGWSPGVFQAAATEPPAAIPRSFADVAAKALAASIVIREAGPVTVGVGALPIPAEGARDEDIYEDETEEDDPTLARRALVRGSGVIVHPRGVAVTSARTVLATRRLGVFLLDGTPLEATVVGIDVRTDVAVLRLDTAGSPLPHLPMGDSDSMKTGDWVVMIGAPLGLEGTVAAGIVTAVPTLQSADPQASYLQTDAVLAGGNRGGPLVNVAGEVVGLANLVSDTTTYALPATTLRRIALELLEKGRVSRPWLGIATQSLSRDIARALGVPSDAGVLVADVRPGGPGADAGLRPGDVVVELNAVRVTSRCHFDRLLSVSRPGQVVRMKISQDGRTSSTSITVAEDPEEAPISLSLTSARHRLGLDVRPLEPVTGAVVRDLDLGSPAGRAGIRAGDVVHEVNRRPVRTVADFQEIVQALTPGAPVLIRVQRGSVILYVVVNTSAR